ncbi:MAG: IS110 family transposase, partial [Desulfotomaculales bacterium]
MNKRTSNLTQVRAVHTLIVGVDIAKKNHWARMLDGRMGIEVDTAFKFKNSTEGFARLLGRMSRARERIGAENIIVAMEPSGHYWKPLAGYLSRAGITVVIVNPYHVKKQKELDDNSPTKNDRKDALIIATLTWQGRFFRCYLPEGIWAELRGYTHSRWQQKRKLNAALNNLAAILDEYFPEYAEVFKNLLGKASMHILAHLPFPADITKLTEEELAQELKAASSGRVGKKRAALLLSKARESIGVREGLTSARLRLTHCLAEISFWQEQLAQTEAAMADTLALTGLADYILSIKGVGIVTAAGFLGEVGDLTRYEDWRQIRKLAGFNLTENSSGSRKGKTGISKRGRPGLRNLLYQASLTLVAKNPQFKALYQHLRTRRENPLKGKQALVVIACKLLRVMFTLAKENRLYDPE